MEVSLTRKNGSKDVASQNISDTHENSSNGDQGDSSWDKVLATQV